MPTGTTSTLLPPPMERMKEPYGQAGERIRELYRDHEPRSRKTKEKQPTQPRRPSWDEEEARP